MKVLIDTNKSSVQPVTEQIKTLDAVASATRIFLGVAIGTGLMISGAAIGWMVFPAAPTSKSAAVATSKNQPLKVMDVTRAVSLLSLLEPAHTYPFNPQQYLAGKTVVYEQDSRYGEFDTTPLSGGKNEPLKIRLSSTANSNATSRGPRFGIQTAHAQATPFSIEPIPGETFPDQYIFLWYRLAGDTSDRMITLCLGRTDGSTVYVGSDGSTYVDGKLRSRTTSRTCSELFTLNYGVEQLTEGSIEVADQPVNPGSYWVVRTARVLGRWDNGVLAYLGEPDSSDRFRSFVAHFKSPILMAFAPADETQLNVPSASVHLVDGVTEPNVSIRQSLCFPAVTFDPATGGPVVYFDRQGNSYSDMFLESALTCSHPTEVTGDSRSPSEIPIEGIDW
ncbi:MAG: hypothetical protein HYY50_02125 [Candidatus Kerfeldbacteria bacterium]|nr:hypothetical protein [Candidatus Kerfeldbacteria bacterium]